MRTKLRSKFTLLFMTFAVLLAIPAVALADTLIVNDLVTNTDTSKAPGGTGTANVWLNTTNGDPSGDTNGCNASTATATGQAATVTLSSTNSAISFPNGASAALTACGSENAKQIAYKVADDAQAGQAVIKGAVTGGKSGQTNLYNVNDALTVTITAPAKQNTAVSNVSGSGTYGGSADLTATLKTAAGTALSGKSVTFTLNGNSVGSANTDASGVATKSVSLSGIDAGTYTNYVSANFAGDASNNGSTGSGDLTVSKAAGSVSIDNLPGNAVFGGDFTPTYTKAGDGSASTTSNTPSICSVSSTGVVNFDAAGTCKLQASVTEGTNHRAATGSEQTFEIAKAPATLSYASGTLSKTYNGSAQGVTVNTTPENLSGVSISYSNKNADGTKGSALSGAPTNAGSYIVEASLTNNNYQATSISDTLVIAKANADIDVQGFSGTYDGAAKGASGTATGADGSNLNSLLDLGAKFTNVPGGTANWSFAGNDNHKATSSSVAIQIAKVATTTTVSCDTGPFTYNGSAQINYVGAKLTIGAWTTKGFYAPVDMRDSAGNIMVNTVKGGSTVPMKFELFKGATELKDVSAVKSTTYTKSAACNGAYTDEIEVVMTGNTSLRFDATGDQFIYNWKTPTGAGCYKVTMTALDGSSLSAYFKTR